MAQLEGGKLLFGIEGLKNKTPEVIKWVFRTEFVLNKMFTLWLASTKLLGNMRWDIQEVLLVVTVIDFGTWAFARFFGIKKTDMEESTAPQ
jgi:hypothetical protein